MGNTIRRIDAEESEEKKTTEPSPKPQQTFSQSDEEWISLLRRADQLLCDKSRLSESCRLAGTEIMDVYELLSGYRSRTLNSREIANSRRERESLILGILKRDPEVVTKAGIDNALYSIIGEDRVDIGGTAGTFEDIENAIVVFARIRLAYQRKINEDTILSNAAASKSGQEPFQNESTPGMSGTLGLNRYLQVNFSHLMLNPSSQAWPLTWGC